MLQNDSVKPGTKDTNQARTARAVRALSVAAALGNNRLYSTPPPRARSRGRTPPRPQRPGTPGDAGGAAWRASSRAPAPANVPPTPAGCARGLAGPPCAPPRGDSTRPRPGQCPRACTRRRLPPQRNGAPRRLSPREARPRAQRVRVGGLPAARERARPARAWPGAPGTCARCRAAAHGARGAAKTESRTMNARRRGVGGPGRSGAEGGDPHELLVLEAQRLQVRGLARPERVELRTMGRS